MTERSQKSNYGERRLSNENNYRLIFFILARIKEGLQKKNTEKLDFEVSIKKGKIEKVVWFSEIEIEFPLS